VLELELTGLRRRLAEKGVALELDKKATDYLAENGYDEAYGARPMRRLITKLIEDPLASQLVAGECLPGSTARIRLKDDALVVKVVPAGKASAVSVQS